MEFSGRLKELREAKNLTQPELAKILNISKQAISNWESGRRVPDQTMMLNISYFFGVTVDSLMKGVNSDTSDDRETTIGDLAKKIIDKLEDADVLNRENIDDEDIWKIVIKQVRKDLEKNQNIKKEDASE